MKLQLFPALAVLSLMSCSNDTPPGSSNTSAFVLIHGAWGNGDEFVPVAEILRAKGHEVFMPTLSGLGENQAMAPEDVDLSVHIDDVLNLFESKRIERAVLLGHSYGGMVITGVADRIPERIAALVYLDAALPEPNQSLIDVLGPDQLAQEILAARDRGEAALPFPARAAEEFAIPPEDLAKIPPHPIATFTEPIRLTGTHGSVDRKIYVTSDFQAYRSAYDRVVADPAWRTEIAPTGHNVHMEAPELTARILEQALSD